MDQECTWLLGSFCHIVVSNILGRRRTLKVEVLVGSIRSRLQQLSARSVVQSLLYTI